MIGMGASWAGGAGTDTAANGVKAVVGRDAAAVIGGCPPDWFVVPCGLTSLVDMPAHAFTIVVAVLGTVSVSTSL